jgi:hypothetical protein
LLLATTIQDFDLIAIQEVVAGYGGAQAVTRLAGELNRKGTSWDYVISDPTSVHTNRTICISLENLKKKIGKAWLEKDFI